MSAAYLRYGNDRLDDSLPNVTMTVGNTDSVFCMRLTEPAPARIIWYNPQGQPVPWSSVVAVYQYGADDGKAAVLRFLSFQQRQSGTYECRVYFRDKMVMLPVCIGEW